MDAASPAASCCCRSTIERLRIEQFLKTELTQPPSSPEGWYSVKCTDGEWTTYRTRFLIRARQLDEAFTFVDCIGREHSGRKGDYLVQSSDGSRRIAPREIFEDIYVPLDSPVTQRPASAELDSPQAVVVDGRSGTQISPEQPTPLSHEPVTQQHRGAFAPLPTPQVRRQRDARQRPSGRACIA